jgi:hypothetical protein
MNALTIPKDLCIIIMSVLIIQLIIENFERLDFNAKNHNLYQILIKYI